MHITHVHAQSQAHLDANSHPHIFACVLFQCLLLHYLYSTRSEKSIALGRIRRLIAVILRKHLYGTFDFQNSHPEYAETGGVRQDFSHQRRSGILSVEKKWDTFCSRRRQRALWVSIQEGDAAWVSENQPQHSVLEPQP